VEKPWSTLHCAITVIVVNLSRGYLFFLEEEKGNHALPILFIE